MKVKKKSPNPEKRTRRSREEMRLLREEIKKKKLEKGEAVSKVEVEKEVLKKTYEPACCHFCGVKYEGKKILYCSIKYA